MRARWPPREKSTVLGESKMASRKKYRFFGESKMDSRKKYRFFGESKMASRKEKKKKSSFWREQDSVEKEKGTLTASGQNSNQTQSQPAPHCGGKCGRRCNLAPPKGTPEMTPKCIQFVWLGRGWGGRGRGGGGVEIIKDDPCPSPPGAVPYLPERSWCLRRCACNLPSATP